jgi:hypothetical protein
MLTSLSAREWPAGLESAGGFFHCRNILAGAFGVMNRFFKDISVFAQTGFWGATILMSAAC